MFKKFCFVLFLTLFFLYNMPLSSYGQHYFIDFESSEESSIWSNVNVIFDTVFSDGNHVALCDTNVVYGFGFNIPVPREMRNKAVVMSLSMYLNALKCPDALFVVSTNRNGENVYWASFPLANGFIEPGAWWNFSLSVVIPYDHHHDSDLKCYIYNVKSNDRILIDDVELEISEAPNPSFLPNLSSSYCSSYLYNISTIDSTLTLLYSKKDKKLMLGDMSCIPVSKPLSLYLSYIIDDDTLECQSDMWKLTKVSDESNVTMHCFKNKNDIAVTEMNVASTEGSTSLDITLNTKFKNDVKLLRASLVMPFFADDAVFYRRFPLTSRYKQEYYLDKEGFSVSHGDEQISIYHPSHLSSIQFDGIDMTAVLNMDYHHDHPMIHFPLRNDTADVFVDVSHSRFAGKERLSSSFVITISRKCDLPRIMPVWEGFEAAVIFTEHADWSDIRTHRAVCFGSEDIVSADSAVGGYVYYDVPVTKSVFFNNPDSVCNIEKNSDFPGLHASLSDDDFLDFMIQLKNKGFDICLHTPEQYTSSPENLEQAMSFMKKHFNTKTWIDHGYNNSEVHNREDMVCDGLNPSSPYYLCDLWKQNGVEFPWNASLEETRIFDAYRFDCNLTVPYSAFSDCMPLPRVHYLPDNKDFMLWTTTYTMEPLSMWGYYLSENRLRKITDFREVFIIHCYSPWVTEDRGFWTNDNGKIVAKPDFNAALQRIAVLKEKKMLLPTTVERYMQYQKQLRDVSYIINYDGSIVLINNGKDLIKGLTLVSSSDIIAVDKQYEKKRSDEEYMIWFDLEPDEKVIIK